MMSIWRSISSMQRGGTSGIATLFKEISAALSQFADAAIAECKRALELDPL
jgi:hypothetical protein